MSTGTPYQEGYKYGLKVARGQANALTGDPEAKGFPASYYEWWGGYKHALLSEAVRLRSNKSAQEAVQ